MRIFTNNYKHNVKNILFYQKDPNISCCFIFPYNQKREHRQQLLKRLSRSCPHESREKQSFNDFLKYSE
jgi:hypothetical protein